MHEFYETLKAMVATALAAAAITVAVLLVGHYLSTTIPNTPKTNTERPVAPW